MVEQERSPRERNQDSQELLQNTGGQSDRYQDEQKKNSVWLQSIREKTAWDWLSLLVVPILISTIAGMFTLFTVAQQNKISEQQNEIFRQRDEAEKERNQQALLIEYLDEISELVEQQLLTLKDDDNSKAQRTIGDLPDTYPIG